MASPDVLAFWALVALMLLTAGGALAPPARDFNVVAGAAIMVTSLAVIAIIQNYFNSMASADAFFWLDLIYAAAFYAIARPRSADTPASVRSRDWASRVALILLYIAFVEMTHFAADHETPIGTIVAGLVCALSAIVLVGALRARGLSGLAVALAALLGTAYFTLISFVPYLNCLTALAIAQIAWQGGRASLENLRAGRTRRLSPAPRRLNAGAFARRL